MCFWIGLLIKILEEFRSYLFLLTSAAKFMLMSEKQAIKKQMTVDIFKNSGKIINKIIVSNYLERNLSLIASMVFSTIGWQTEASELTTKFSS